MINRDWDPGIKFFKGCVNAVLIVLPFWCILAAGVIYVTLKYGW